MAASPAPVVCSTAPVELRLAPRPWPARRRRLHACNACELLQAALRARAAELFSRIVGVRVGSYRSRASRHRSLTPETACRSDSPRSPPLLPRALSPPSACRRFEARQGRHYCIRPPRSSRREPHDASSVTNQDNAGRAFRLTHARMSHAHVFHAHGHARPRASRKPTLPYLTSRHPPPRLRAPVSSASMLRCAALPLACSASPSAAESKTCCTGLARLSR